MTDGTKHFSLSAGLLVAGRIRRALSQVLYEQNIDHEWKVLGGIIERDMVLTVRGTDDEIAAVSSWLHRTLLLWAADGVPR